MLGGICLEATISLLGRHLLHECVMLGSGLYSGQSLVTVYTNITAVVTCVVAECDFCHIGVFMEIS